MESDRSSAPDRVRDAEIEPSDSDCRRGLGRPADKEQNHAGERRARPCLRAFWSMRERVSQRRVLVEPETVTSGGVRLAAYRLGGSGAPLMLGHAPRFHA